VRNGLRCRREFLLDRGKEGGRIRHGVGPRRSFWTALRWVFQSSRVSNSAFELSPSRRANLTSFEWACPAFDELGLCPMGRANLSIGQRINPISNKLSGHDIGITVRIEATSISSNRFLSWL
jgi:hypothetical protein